MFVSSYPRFTGPLRFLLHSVLDRLGVDHFALGDARSGAARRLRAALLPRAGFRRLRRTLQLLHAASHRLHVFSLHRFPHGIDRRADARALDVGNARLVLVEELLGAVRRGVGRVARVNHLAPLLILARMALRLLDEPVDVLLAETTRRGDRDLLLLARRL